MEVINNEKDTYIIRMCCHDVDRMLWSNRNYQG